MLTSKEQSLASIWTRNISLLSIKNKNNNHIDICQLRLKQRQGLKSNLVWQKYHFCEAYLPIMYESHEHLLLFESIYQLNHVYYMVSLSIFTQLLFQ